MQRPLPTDTEVLFDGGIMITETDTRGRITYVNRKFIDLSAYSKEELIGASHSIMRHPDMPRACFRNMWDTLKTGQTWKGYVKNLRKDGAYYWVIVYVSPKYDDDGTLLGYIAARKVPEEKTLEAIKEKYGKMVELECCNQNEEAHDLVRNLFCEDMAAVG